MSWRHFILSGIFPRLVATDKIPPSAPLSTLSWSFLFNLKIQAWAHTLRWGKYLFIYPLCQTITGGIILEAIHLFISFPQYFLSHWLTHPAEEGVRKPEEKIKSQWGRRQTRRRDDVKRTCSPLLARNAKGEESQKRELGEMFFFSLFHTDFMSGCSGVDGLECWPELNWLENESTKVIHNMLFLKCHWRHLTL